MSRGYHVSPAITSPVSLKLDRPLNYGPASQGKKSFEAGKPKSSCPYKIGTNDRVGWLAGWWGANKVAAEKEDGLVSYRAVGE